MINDSDLTQTGHGVGVRIRMYFEGRANSICLRIDVQSEKRKRATGKM
jgi:hypothetical protein